MWEQQNKRIVENEKRKSPENEDLPGNTENPNSIDNENNNLPEIKHGPLNNPKGNVTENNVGPNSDYSGIPKTYIENYKKYREKNDPNNLHSSDYIYIVTSNYDYTTTNYDKFKKHEFKKSKDKVKYKYKSIKARIPKYHRQLKAKKLKNYLKKQPINLKSK